MMYDEERAEERINAMPRHLRDLWQPDGMSAPPERPILAPLPQRRDPNDCRHPRHFIIEIVGEGPQMIACLECGTEVKE